MKTPILTMNRLGTLKYRKWADEVLSVYPFIQQLKRGTPEGCLQLVNGVFHGSLGGSLDVNLMMSFALLFFAAVVVSDSGC
ncbi:hypothetical protein NL676_035762 [Syzygium grande]|nr:hypothetical protein NL676_035762 [Syzygium grande]